MESQRKTIYRKLKIDKYDDTLESDVGTGDLSLDTPMLDCMCPQAWAANTTTLAT